MRILSSFNALNKDINIVIHVGTLKFGSNLGAESLKKNYLKFSNLKKPTFHETTSAQGNQWRWAGAIKSAKNGKNDHHSGYVYYRP